MLSKIARRFVLFSCGLLFYVTAMAGGMEDNVTSKKADIAALVQGRVSNALKPALLIIDTPQSWRQSLARYVTSAETWVSVTLFQPGAERRQDSSLSADSPPPLDLANHVALGVFAGRLEAGAPWIEIKRITIEGVTAYVCFTVTETLPTARAVKNPSPFAFIFINRPERAIEQIRRACR